MSSIDKKLKFIIIILYKLEQKFVRKLYCLYYPFVKKNIKKVHILSINDTINSLVNTNKSISRFGDGEITWIFNSNKFGSFEKPSKLLRKRLLQVLTSNNSHLEIGLPDEFRNITDLTKGSANFWKSIIARYWKRLFRYIQINKIYYNTNISRCYMDYKDKSGSKYIFNNLKRIWNNKNILIIEGQDSRLGVTSGLLSNSKSIKRIECPPENAFEYYNKIIRASLNFLHNHNKYLVLLSLGPTATVLSYDLCRKGYRSIDIGNVDLEYEWFLRGATSKINIPSKYVNSIRLKNGKNVIKIHNKKYQKEIYCYIK